MTYQIGETLRYAESLYEVRKVGVHTLKLQSLRDPKLRIGCNTNEKLYLEKLEKENESAAQIN